MHRHYTELIHFMLSVQVMCSGVQMQVSLVVWMYILEFTVFVLVILWKSCVAQSHWLIG